MKWFIIIALLAVIVILSGCVGTKDDPNIVVKTSAIWVSNPNYANNITSFTDNNIPPYIGKRYYVVINYNIINNKCGLYSVNQWNFYLSYNNVLYKPTNTYDDEYVVELNDRLPDVVLSDGGSVKGSVAYEITYQGNRDYEIFGDKVTGCNIINVKFNNDGYVVTNETMRLDDSRAVSLINKSLYDLVPDMNVEGASISLPHIALSFDALKYYNEVDKLTISPQMQPAVDEYERAMVWFDLAKNSYKRSKGNSASFCHDYPEYCDTQEAMNYANNGRERLLEMFDLMPAQTIPNFLVTHSTFE